MTREELKAHCEKQVEMCEMWARHNGEEPQGKTYEEHKLILELLERESCGNAISKEAVLDKINQIGVKGFETYTDYSELFDFVDSLPPVTPQPKYEDITKAFQLGLAFGFGEKHDEMDKVVEEIKKVVTPQPKIGQWEMCEDSDGIYGVCSECGQDADFSHYGKAYGYCPNCGAKMESEGEE